MSCLHRARIVPIYRYTQVCANRYFTQWKSDTVFRSSRLWRVKKKCRCIHHMGTIKQQKKKNIAIQLRYIYERHSITLSEDVSMIYCYINAPSIPHEVRVRSARFDGWKKNNNTGCETAWGRRMGVSRFTPRHFYLIFFPPRSDTGILQHRLPSSAIYFRPENGWRAAMLVMLDGWRLWTIRLQLVRKTIAYSVKMSREVNVVEAIFIIQVSNLLIYHRSSIYRYVTTLILY